MAKEAPDGAVIRESWFVIRDIKNGLADALLIKEPLSQLR